MPKQHTTGGKDGLAASPSRVIDTLRWLLVAGAMAVIRYAQKHGTKRRPWLGQLMGRRPTKVAAVALANKMARMAWAIIAGPWLEIQGAEVADGSVRDAIGLIGNTNWRGHDDVMQIRWFQGIGRARLGQRTSSKCA